MTHLFNHLLGNEPIKAYLREALRLDRLHHTLLFCGPKGIGKARFAQALASHLLESPLERIEKETHPDLRVLRPEGKSGTHAIEQLRDMIDGVSKPPFEAKQKVFILHDAERMQTAAANALLKTLEEPNLGCMILLLTDAPSEMLPTILSRTIRLAFQPIEQELIATFLEREKGLDRRAAETAARLCNGTLSETLEIIEESPLRRSLFDALSGVKPSFEAIEEIEESLESFEGLSYHHKVLRLLSDYLMYARDQDLRKSQAGEHLLYFPDEAPATLTLEKAEKLASEVKTALERHVKLSACLQRLFSI